MRRIARWLLLTAFFCARAVAQSAPEQPLVVEQLVCRGNASTSCTFILGQVYLAEGDVVDEEELQNAKLRLLWLRNFQSVSIYLEKGSVRGRARVVVEVVEAKPITTELAYGLFDQDTSVGGNISGRITHYNLFGTGKIFDARANIIAPWSGPTIRQYFGRAVHRSASVRLEAQLLQCRRCVSGRHFRPPQRRQPVPRAAELRRDVRPPAVGFLVLHGRVPPSADHRGELERAVLAGIAGALYVPQVGSDLPFSHL
jgi:hypothetical protein